MNIINFERETKFKIIKIRRWEFNKKNLKFKNKLDTRMF
jgi:hypothetical protein